MKRIMLNIIFCLSLTTTFAQHIDYPKYFVVAKDGSGNFRTVQDAVFAVRDLSQVQVTIMIKNGIYKEKVVIPSWKTNITLLGESRDSTIITYDDYAGKRLTVTDQFLKTDTLRTYTSYTLLVQGNDCHIEDITIRNTAGRVGQAVALHVEGDRFGAERCSFLGNQDTYYAAKENSRQFLRDCYIEGTTDFIFGEAIVVFYNCTIKSLANSYITASSARENKDYGFVFLKCKLVADTPATKVYLGRPWRPYAKTVFLNTEMGTHILPQGWDNWKNPQNEKTTYYAEYKSIGSGANPSARVKWSHQLSKKQAIKYTLYNIFNGWRPSIDLK